PKIIIAGAPASGKGTQCSMIKERYGVVHLSTGGCTLVDQGESGRTAVLFGRFLPQRSLVLWVYVTDG
ncbi:unnamed protein product, partial [Ectocarpus sp. 12 AP-2014]